MARAEDINIEHLAAAMVHQALADYYGKSGQLRNRLKRRRLGRLIRRVDERELAGATEHALSERIRKAVDDYRHPVRNPFTKNLELHGRVMRDPSTGKPLRSVIYVRSLFAPPLRLSWFDEQKTLNSDLRRRISTLFGVTPGQETAAGSE